ncbi:hypothetical protein [Amycolatopsis sp. PS_44_ISF1]|uniref:hypothetical protein n=1 Tax=Amycolatopsis sp. PS_44_ISF1 TaxID=2974917 RepID=UPI0028DEF87F|nr:hypothetical protein [Amycolatopsis sp. PS_44_ISF1]MDT8914791.1 hypothetical protein [Amycolatopsis sp. PS_44_ISF1]
MAGPHFSSDPSDTAPLGAVPAHPGPPAPGRGPARDNRTLLLRGAGLVAIAVVSGLVWFLIRHDSAPDPVAQPPAKTSQFDFKLVEGPSKSTDCAANSYGKAQGFFTDTPCASLARALYTVESGDAKALVSVALVSMPQASQAADLKKLTDQDGTGNITDLVRDHTYKASGAPSVSGEKAAYESEVAGSDVTIVLTDFFEKHKDPVLLKRIAKDALQLSAGLR